MQEKSKSSLTVPNSNRKEFISRLKSAIEPYSVRSFAKRAGIAPTTFNNVVNGDSEPTRLTLLAIAAAAGVSLHWLITGQGPKHSGSQEPEPDQATRDAMNFVDREQKRPELDEEVLLAAIQAVEADLHDRGETMEPSDKSRLIYLLYRTRMKEKDQSLTEPKSVMSSLLGKSRNGRTGRNNTPDELLEIPQRQRSRKQGTDE